jgi:hypothetical protein
MLYSPLTNGFGPVLLVTLLTVFAATTAADDDPSNRVGPGMGIHPDTVLPALKADGWSKPIAGAQAAPQILGVVASHGPIPLNCSDDGCRADLSTFCLQQSRGNPVRGQAYVPAEGADIVLRGIDGLGRNVLLTATPYVEFATDRGFTAIEVTLPPEKLTDLGLFEIAVDIGAGVSLVPVAAANDRDLQTADEIALATGAFREKGAELFDRIGETGDAIRLANQMINALPAHARSLGESDSHVLEAALATGTGQASTVEGIGLARLIYANCQKKVDLSHHFKNMRSCLESAHDQLVANMNADLWATLANY